MLYFIAGLFCFLFMVGLFSDNPIWFAFKWMIILGGLAFASFIAYAVYEVANGYKI
jgi:hypothetical protein